MQRIAETLRERGIDELAGDRELLTETVAAPDDWTYGPRTCRYVPGMIAGWLTDTPKARPPWLQSQAGRIAAAHRWPNVRRGLWASRALRMPCRPASHGGGLTYSTQPVSNRCSVRSRVD